MQRFLFLAPLLLSLFACGGNSSTSSSSNAGSGSPPGQAAIVNVAAGQTSTGVNITVASPVASPAPNAQVLGVGTTASNTGAQISQGATGQVFLCGPGLSGNMQVKISGPPDITVSGISAVQCTDSSGNKVSGIQFTAAVNSGAGLGGRTVFLMDTQNDITTFTGGLEVVQ